MSARVFVPGDAAAISVGADEVAAAFEAAGATVVRNGSRGMLWLEPLVEVETEAVGSPFEASIDGPAYQVMAGAMQEAFGTPMTTLGQGGSIPLCNVFADTYPGAEIILMGVEEPLALIHAPNESVDPDDAPAPEAGRNLDQHRALRDD